MNKDMKNQFKEMGLRLKHEREKTGLNVADFSKIGNVANTAQYNYEKGARKPDAEYLHLIAQFGCDIQFIITGVRSEGHLDDWEHELIKSFIQAPKYLQDACWKLLK